MKLTTEYLRYPSACDPIEGYTEFETALIVAIMASLQAAGLHMIDPAGRDGA